MARYTLTDRIGTLAYLYPRETAAQLRSRLIDDGHEVSLATVRTLRKRANRRRAERETQDAEDRKWQAELEAEWGRDPVKTMILAGKTNSEIYERVGRRCSRSLNYPYFLHISLNYIRVKRHRLRAITHRVPTYDHRAIFLGGEYSLADDEDLSHGVGGRTLYRLIWRLLRQAAREDDDKPVYDPHALILDQDGYKVAERSALPKDEPDSTMSWQEVEAADPEPPLRRRRRKRRKRLDRDRWEDVRDDPDEGNSRSSRYERDDFRRGFHPLDE